MPPKKPPMFKVTAFVDQDIFESVATANPDEQRAKFLAEGCKFSRKGVTSYYPPHRIARVSVELLG